MLFSSTPCIGSKIFNYNQVVREFTDLENVKCICKEYRGFINDDRNHVVTGNLDIFTNEKLKTKGYSETGAHVQGTCQCRF